MRRVILAVLLCVFSSIVAAQTSIAINVKVIDTSNGMTAKELRLNESLLETYILGFMTMRGWNIAKSAKEATYQGEVFIRIYVANAPGGYAVSIAKYGIAEGMSAVAPDLRRVPFNYGVQLITGSNPNELNAAIEDDIGDWLKRTF